MKKQGEMIDGTLYSPSLKLDWNYSAYRPYLEDHESIASLPVVYLLHGATGNHRNLSERFPLPTYLDEMIATGEVSKCVVIFVDGFNSFYVDSSSFKMETAIIEDLIPTLEKRLELKPNRDRRYIGGLSMGGYGASNLGLRYPELFSKVMALSPAVWHTMTPETVTYDWHVFRDDNGNFDHNRWKAEHPESHLEAYQSKEFSVSFFVMSGEQDAVVPINEVRQYVAALSEVAAVQVHYTEDGDHSWPFWEIGTLRAFKEFF